MTDNDIELKAYSFVPKIIESKEPNKKDITHELLNGSLAEKDFVDLSEFVVDVPAIVTQYFSDLSDKKIYILIKGIKYGFSEIDYKEFYRFIFQFYEHKKLSNLVSIEYLKEKVLLWIVDIYIKNFSAENLCNYLSRLLDNDINRYSFYYPILNIDIEQEFYIGDGKITYFTKEYFENLFKEKSAYNIAEEDFNDLYKKYLGQVFVAVEIKAERKLASILAYEKACYIIDVLKLTCPTVYIPFEKCFLELESKIPPYYEYISFKNDNKYEFSLNKQVNRSHQISYTLEMIKGITPLFKQLGWLFSSQKEIDNLVKQSVIFYSKCISEDDLHLRISKFIMIIESIFLKDSETNGMVSKSKTRLLNFKFHNVTTEYRNKIKSILDNMYQIRHKMTHKSIRLYIDNEELRVFQGELIEILLMLSQKSQIFNSKNEFLDELDKIDI